MGVFIYDTAPYAANEATREAAVRTSGVLTLMDHPSLQPLVEDAARRFRARFAVVSIIVSDWQYIIAAHNMPTGVTRRSNAFCAHAVLQPQTPFVVPDASADDRFAENPNVVDAPGIRFYAGAALLDQPDVALGTLCVFDPRPRADFRRVDAAALAACAADVTAAIGSLATPARRRITA